jgi:phospholipid-binding lipoprotein MlaA
MSRSRKFNRSLCWMALSVALLQGCATGPNANPRDPWEPFNRNVAGFNEGLDDALIRPAATAYQNITPEPIRMGVSNFFNNLSDVWSLVNNVLQLKPRESVETLMRVSVNTVFGIAGVFDIATDMRLERHREDFGQTLGYWGVPTGPYVVLPILGPSTVRDSLALGLESQGDLIQGLNHVATRNSLYALRAVDLRAGLLRASSFLDDAALDKYSFTRDAYLQRRRGLVREDGASSGERFDLPESAPANASSAGIAAPSSPVAAAEAAPSATSPAVNTTSPAGAN